MEVSTHQIINSRLKQYLESILSLRIGSVFSLFALLEIRDLEEGFAVMVDSESEVLFKNVSTAVDYFLLKRNAMKLGVDFEVGNPESWFSEKIRD